MSVTLEGLVCRIGDRRLPIPSRYLGASEVQKPGDRGRLVLPRWLATHLHLSPS